MDDILIDLGGGRAPTSHDDITLSPFTTRKLGISTGRKTPVSIGSSPGTITSVLNAYVFSTG